MPKITTQFSRRVLTVVILLLTTYYATNAQDRSLQDSTKNLSLGGQNQEIDILYRTTKPKKYLTSAVPSISGTEVSNIPGANRLNSLAGRLPGLTVLQDDGVPGVENSALLIRGSHSFAGNGRPLILINGRVDDISMIEPNDIESITVLKDAASTALYGLNSANGILLVTTKRGKAQKLDINYHAESSFQQPTRTPKRLDAYNYALLYNEAQLNDNPSATVAYNSAALDAYRTGSDPYAFPDVNWTDQALKDNSLQVRNNLNIRGGTKDVNFYFSGSYLKDNGIFNVNKDINTYNTNSTVDVFNVRANIGLNVTKNLQLFTDIRSKREKRTAPGAYTESYDQNIFSAIYGTPANAYPVTNADGSLGGTNTYTDNPYGILNYRGYNNYIVGSTSSFSELVYDFNSLLSGLKLKANFGYTTFTEFNLNRAKNFAVYQPTSTGTYTEIGTTTAIATTGTDYRQRNRIFDHSAAAYYDTEFGDHAINSFLMYERLQFDYNTGSGNNLAYIGRTFQGPKTSISYRYKNRYLVDLVASYQGNEQFPKGDRYGFFPAIAAGWIISDESFLQNSGNTLSFLKLRGSYGKTGRQPNSVLETDGIYFNYLTNYRAGIAADGFGSPFGTNPANSIGAFVSQIANPQITWEKTLKGNIGLDIALFDNKLNASFDYFDERTEDILVSGAISAMYGNPVLSPTGTFKNNGFEIQAGWADRVGDFQYSIAANLAVAKNTITNMDEETRPFDYLYRTGNSFGGRYGYVFDRFFTETDTPGSYPDQSLLGAQQPGDLKYKDLNGDNIIKDNDITFIGNSRLPETNFGINLGSKYKAWDLNVFFQGVDGGTTYNAGLTQYEFFNRRGNVFEHHLNRWTPGSGQSAGYPRLTLNNQNNFVSSSYWVRDNSFVRLKYAELGYSLPKSLVSKIGISGTRIFINGNNVFLWDKLDGKDPEALDNGIGYPRQRSVRVGRNVKF